MKYTKIFLFIAAIVGMVLFLGNTRLGVFIVFDVLGGSTDNLDTNPKNGPVEITRYLEANSKFKLPKKVEQASGIILDEENVYISTDQAELYIFDLSFNQIKSEFELLSGILILKQGALEGIALTKNSQILGVGEIGAIGVWSNVQETWKRQDDIPLSSSFSKMEFTGICRNSKGIWITTDSAVEIYDLSSSTDHTLNFNSSLKSNRNLSELLISGIDCDETNYYLITENYTSIIILDKSFTITDIIGIDAGEASDIAVHDQQAYVTVDHNYFDPHPPVYKYNLAE